MLVALHSHLTTEDKVTGSTNPLGHSYLEITNSSSNSIYIGGFEIQSGYSSTIGFWGKVSIDYENISSVTPPSGIYFNREAFYYSNLENVITNCTAIHIVSTSYVSLLNQITETYQNSKYNILSNNCSHFANGAIKSLTGFSYCRDGFACTPYELCENILNNTYPVLENFPIIESNYFYGYQALNCSAYKYYI